MVSRTSWKVAGHCAANRYGAGHRSFFVPGTKCQARVLECLAPLPVPGSERWLWGLTQLWKLGAWRRAWRGSR